ncbi:SH3 domain-containing protein [bacterium]|nr:SH3 domain-containing protein [bacterium]
MTHRKRAGALALLLLLAAAVLAAGPQRSVQVREGKLRQSPSFLGKITADVAYGDRMEVLEETAGWTRVRDGSGRSGWIHASALTEKKVVLKAGQGDVAAGASGEEIALAGKGFNEEVEKTYRAANPDVDFAWVDRMETWKVTPDQAAAFVSAGKLVPGGAR